AQIVARPKPNLKRILTSSTHLTWIDSRARSVNPPLTLSLARSVDAGRSRVAIGVVRLISQPDAVFIKPSQGLLEQAWFRIAWRYSSFDDVELVLVHVNPCEGTRFVGVVRQLQLMPFDKIDEIPNIGGQLGIPLHELPRCIHHRPSNIRFPM